MSLGAAHRALTISMPARFETLPTIRSTLRAWLCANRVEPEAADDIVLAAWEACANAIEHPAREDVTYALEAVATDTSVHVTVRDPGSWKEPTPGRPFRGLGLRIVDAVMDRVSIRRSHDGTEVTMCRTARSRT
jgi:anti-sigma regulatory factor (Ser/Thr protein kinase)